MDLLSFTPTDVFDMSKEREWSAKLGKELALHTFESLCLKLVLVQ